MVTGKLTFDSLNYISEEGHRQFTARCKAEHGDVLYSKDGATRGRPCFVDTNKEFSFFVSVALIKPLRDRLDGRYLVHLLNSNWIKDLVVDKSRGDMIPHIVLREIRALPVPLPPLCDQHRIVNELDAFQSRVAELKMLQMRPSPNSTRYYRRSSTGRLRGNCRCLIMCRSCRIIRISIR
jgi:type I restriction enzyme S subunit